MRRLVLSLTALGSAGIFMAAPAMAGSCAPGVPPQNCKVPVQYMSGPAPVFDPVTVHSAQPMSHLRTVQYRSAPNVSIMRVYDQGRTVGLQDFPSKFTQGCHPTSTRYCRQAAPVQAPAPVRAPAPQVVTHRQTVDTSKFTPRVYGSTDLVPGIAHIPTSIVDRSWDNAMAALNSGRTQPQPVVSGGMVPHPSQMSRQVPVAAPMSYASPQPVAPVPVVENHGVVTQTVSGGTYWEKVSGPQMIGNTMATQVICKRQAPDVQVQRPVVGVPVPTGCAQPPAMLHPAPMSEPVLAGGPVSRRYGY